MSEIQWHSSMIYARDSSWTEKKPVLLDFYNPESMGCKQMDAVTYAKDDVVQFIQDHFVPLRMDHANHPFSREYNVIWTPTLIILDQDGREFQRTIGYLESDELLAVLLLGVAKGYFKAGKYDAAGLHLDKILKNYPGSDAAPEALYFQGVNQFKWKDDPKALRTAYERLRQDYPTSSWVERASPYRDL
ncbi:MAG: thioredoxin fold domain-containing protein [Desulfobulbaceae bacterium]|nr:thioredoxin fold domain-containing protein [Desulfobulbaceae bacterium]